MQVGDQLTYELKGVGMIVRKRDSTARVFEQYYDMPHLLNHKFNAMLPIMDYNIKVSTSCRQKDVL